MKNRWPLLEIHPVLFNGEYPLKGKISARLEMYAEGEQLRPVVQFKRRTRRPVRLEFDVTFPIGDLCRGRCCGKNCIALAICDALAKIGFLKIWIEYEGDEDFILFELHLGKEVFETQRLRSEV